MGRPPAPRCRDHVPDAGVKKGRWTPEEDKLLVDYINEHGHGNWRLLPRLAGLNRCGKSCSSRWTNYLRPDIKRGRFTDDEEKLIIHHHAILGNKWSSIATNLPGRTNNEIKKYWNRHISKKLLRMGIDPVTHQRRSDLNLLATPTVEPMALLGLAAANGGASSIQQQLTAPATPTVDPMALVGLAAANGGASSSQQLAAVHQISTTTSMQYDGAMPMLSIPASTSVLDVTQGIPMSSIFFPGLILNGSFSGAGNAPAGDGLSSTELGHNGASGNSMAAPPPMAAPPLVVAAQEHNAGASGSGGTWTWTPSPCDEPPASNPFEGLDNLAMDAGDTWWKDFLGQQTTWFNNDYTDQQ